eukprot:scaffold87284_cov67-Phaeocystis_antarctica.AAC.12
MRAALARQRSAGTHWAVRARLAVNTRLPALALLVRAGRALVARALAGVGLDGAGAALGLLGAACWREVARVGSRAVGSGTKVGPVGVQALVARPRRRRALCAVRAWHAHVALGPARLVHKFACAAPVARGLRSQRLHGTRAARSRTGAARGCVRTWLSWRATARGAKVRLARVRARRARQHGAGTHWAVRAGLASNTCLLAFATLVLAGRAPVARTLACDGLDGAGATPGRLDAASWRVGSCRYVFATNSITEAGEIAPRATWARYTPHAPRLAVVALLACGRSDSGRCSAHVAGRAEAGAQTASLLQGNGAVAVHSSCTCTRVILVLPARLESNRAGSATIICCQKAVPCQIDIVRQRSGQDVTQLATSSDTDRVKQACGIAAMQERSFTQHDSATQVHPHRASTPLLGSDTALEGAVAEDGSTARDPCGTTTCGLAALEHRMVHSQRPSPHLQRPSKLGAALPKSAVLHIQSPAVHRCASGADEPDLAGLRLSIEDERGAVEQVHPRSEVDHHGDAGCSVGLHCSRPHSGSRVEVVRVEAARVEAALVVEKEVEGWAAGAAVVAMAVVRRVAVATVAVAMAVEAMVEVETAEAARAGVAMVAAVREAVRAAVATVAVERAVAMEEAVMEEAVRAVAMAAVAMAAVARAVATGVEEMVAVATEEVRAAA